VASTDVAEAIAAVDDPRPEGETAETGGHRPPLQEEGSVSTNVWSDEAAESAFLAEARDRGETVATKAPAATATEEADPKTLPPLEDLVKRLSPELRETLDDLFRAKFVAVRRIPKKALNP
jgi:hypothetical protein